MYFEFNVGDKVRVEPLYGDLFDEEFIGTITEISHDSVHVIDDDYEPWIVEKSQVFFANIFE
jgi:hypothetical protein